MLYQLTEKGKKMWPDGVLRKLRYESFVFGIIYSDYHEKISYGPADFKALIDLGLIEESTSNK
jgi:hypothetical protein